MAKSASMLARAAVPVNVVAKAQGLEAAANVKLEQIRAQGRADIELIRDRARVIAKAFVEMGQAIVRLKEPVVYQALGYASFAALCEAELPMAPRTADELATIATQFTAEEALGMGQKKALAVLRLCRATVEDDTPSEVAKATVTLPSGKKFEVKSASARRTAEVAAEIGAATERGGKRGQSAKREERAAGATLEAKLRAAGLSNARVRVVKGKKRQGALLRMDGIPLAQLRTVCQAICGGRR